MDGAALVRARENTIAALAPALREAGLNGDRLDRALRVQPGHPAKVILKSVEELQADLIVLGPHARRSLFDFGSTTRAVLSRAVVPIWNQPVPVAPIRSILVPVDFSEHSRCALDFAHTLATRLDASLRVLHCYAPPTFAHAGGYGSDYGSDATAVPDPARLIEQDRVAAKDRLERWMAEYDWASVPAEPRFVEGEIIQAIVDETGTADLVVMGTHGRTGLSRFLIGSVAHGAIKHALKPVVVVPSPSRTWLLTESEPLAAHRIAPASALLA